MNFHDSWADFEFKMNRFPKLWIKMDDSVDN